jgi:hypothetical protein
MMIDDSSDYTVTEFNFVNFLNKSLSILLILINETLYNSVGATSQVLVGLVCIQHHERKRVATCLLQLLQHGFCALI